MDKNELRRTLIGRRSGLSEGEQERRSLLAQSLLLKQPDWQNASSVALYAAIKGEVHTGLLLEDAWKNGKQVFLPRVVHGAAGLMDFAICASYDELRPGAFGIQEPEPQLCPACCFAVMPEGPGYSARAVHPLPDLFIIPGLAFDRAGRRLGWGGGYYDRFLPLIANSRAGGGSDGKGCSFVGFAYSFQVVDNVPADTWDIPVDAICTDKEFLWMK